MNSSSVSRAHRLLSMMCLGFFGLDETHAGLFQQLTANDPASITRNASNVVSAWADNSGNANHAVSKIGPVIYPASIPFPSGVIGLDFGDTRNGLQLLDVADTDAQLNFTGPAAGKSGFAAKGDSMAFLLDYRHRTEKGTLRLLWEGPEMPRQPDHPGALRDAWGRFITNEGKSPDWWLQLTQMGKEMINGKRNPADPEPALSLNTKEKSTHLKVPATH